MVLSDNFIKNLNILLSDRNHSMIKQRSSKNIKPPSRQKIKTYGQVPHSKPAQTQSRNSKIQAFQPSHSNNSSKGTKNESKSKSQKGTQQANKTKPICSHKNSPDNHAIYMKGNLKQLMSKNATIKHKTNEVVPQLLKNIEKHCRELKKIHDKQPKVYEKRTSLQQNKVQKGNRFSAGNRSHDVQSRKKKQHPKQPYKPKETLQPEENRYSLQIHPKVEEPADVLTNERLVRKSPQTTETKNIIELFKIYKKNFEIQDIKVGKSNKNTNYNTNQSKNSSSLYNSHRHSALIDQCHKNKGKIDEKINLDNVHNLISSQKNSVSQENSCEKKAIEHQLLPGRKVELSLENSPKVEKLSAQKDNFEDINDGSEFKVELSGAQLVKKWLPHNEIKVPQMGLNKQLEERKSNENSAGKQSEHYRDKEKNFQVSQYYVAPIPKFQPKPKKQEDSRQDDSLAGCEITLIENNVINEDIDEMSLDL